MSYTYPDQEDKLTCQLIETEYDSLYWGKSEEAVLKRAKAAVRSLPGEQLSLLDAGCGLGRLFSVFAEAGIKKITAVEPDIDRYKGALQTAGEINAAEKEELVTVLHGDCSVLPDNSRFQVVLSSHVLQ